MYIPDRALSYTQNSTNGPLVYGPICLHYKYCGGRLHCSSRFWLSIYVGPYFAVFAAFLLCLSFNLLYPRRQSLYVLRPPSLVRDLGKGAVTSQAGFLNLKIVIIMWTFHVSNDNMRYTCSFLHLFYSVC